MKSILSIGLMVLSGMAAGQSQRNFTRTIQNLYKAGAVPDSAQRGKAITQRWAEVRAAGIPLIAGDSVAFFYRGKANAVSWMGDFNGWGYDKTFPNKGKVIPGTDVWILRCAFPRDARFDYEILLNETSWNLDAENPYHQWSGLGGGTPKSEVRMPLWKEDPVHQIKTGIAHGTVKKDILFDSKIMGYQVTYNVYLPAGEPSGKLPVIYVTDGNEYMMPELGDMITILDNLIAEKKMVPIIAVLIDHREPRNRAHNRRMEELNMSEKYLKFFTEEFMPTVEGEYPIQSDAAHRAILGASMGGLTSAYFTFSKPDLISMAGIQSPAFWIRPQIYALCDSAKGTHVRVFLTSGVINDTSDASRKMKEILQNNSCVYQYREINEGHSWGNWRNLIDDILIDFFSKQ